MYCHNCGAQLKDGAKFCTECGANLMGEYSADTAKHVRVNVKQSRGTEQESYKSEPREKRKTHRFFWFVVLLCIAALAVIYLSPVTRNLYFYSGYQVFSEGSLSVEEESKVRKLFEGTCLFFEKQEDDYIIADLETGNGWSLSDLKEAGNGSTEVEIKLTGDSAAVYISDTGNSETLKLSYSLPTFRQRVYFLMKYYFGA